jgi:hypothetical protein
VDQPAQGSGGLGGRNWRKSGPNHTVIYVATCLRSVDTFRGDGRLHTPVLYSVGAPGSTPIDVTITDTNLDGAQDIVTSLSSSGRVVVLVGDGNGTFQAGSPLAGDGNSAQSVQVSYVADLNLDGLPDIIALQPGSVTSHVDIFRGAAAGPVSAPELQLAVACQNIAVGDVNADGIPDVVASGSGLLLTFLGRGDATFVQLRSWRYG